MKNKIVDKLVKELEPLILKLYFYDDLICPYCLRKVPNKEFFIMKGCKWCQKWK
jgi:hypothetical protein